MESSNKWKAISTIVGLGLMTTVAIIVLLTDPDNWMMLITIELILLGAVLAFLLLTFRKDPENVVCPTGTAKVVISNQENENIIKIGCEPIPKEEVTTVK